MVQTDRIDGLTTEVALKAPVKVATTSNITLSGAQTIDGVSVTAGERVLVMNQTDASENGIYVCQSTAWTRAKDWNGNRDVVQGTRVYIQQGSTYAGYQAQVTTSGTITIGTTSVAFSLSLIVDATVSANLATVAGISADVTTVADNMTDISAVADISDDVSGVLVAAAFKYTFSDTTSMADPGAGTVRFNNATLSSVTAMAFDATTADTGNPDVSDYLATWDDSTATPSGYITVRKSGAPATFAVFSVSGSVTDNTGWLQVAVTHIASSGTLSASDTLHISYSRAGDDGADGADGVFTGAEATVTADSADKVAILDNSDSDNPKFVTPATLRTAMSAEPADADILKADVSDQVTVGYSGTSYSTGNTGSGTVTLSVANGNEQHGTVTGSFTMGAPTLAGVGYIKWELTNDGTGGYSPDFATSSDLVNGTYDSTASVVNVVTIRKMNTKTVVDIEQGQ